MILTYETVKYASIQDSRLGLLRYALVGGIFIYVVVFEMWAFGGYLASVPIQGALRFSLQQPTQGNCDPFNDADCQNRFTPVNELIYCRQSVNSSAGEYRGNVYPCEIYEAINAQVITESSILVMTRAKVTNQTLVCGDHLDAHSITTCPHTYETSTTDPNIKDDMPVEPFYIAESEAFTILLDHAVTAAGMCQVDASREAGYACSAPSSDYHGRLYSNNQNLCAEFDTYHQSSFQRRTGYHRTGTAPCYIEPNQTKANLDYFSLDVLLRAAGILSLDDCVYLTTENATNISSGSCQTYRDAGATILLTIEWADFVSYNGMVEPFYYYRAQVVSRSYKTSIPYYHSYRQSRTLLTAHGVRIAVSIAGAFHHFEWMSFLITITTALGLLAVATTVVDSLMLYVLPEKEKYTKAKYEASNDLVVELPNPPLVPTFISDGLSAIRRSAQEISSSKNNLSLNVDMTPNDETLSMTDALLRPAGPEY